jgi:hypothetical protein
MLLRSLALRWATAPTCEESHQCLHSFDLLFFVHADDLQDKASIEEALLACHGDVAESAEGLRQQLQRSAYRVLLLVAGSEENPEKHPLPMELLRGRVLADACVVFAARPSLVRSVQ